ncbi:hypothetical protein AYK20_00295 [Thermoplasmatales archaeon SG8-52-1]|nr:MAG: hypothetical protein AYK20_00295 [Thermoplasmatales archaeon SG8-52-1]
MYIERDAKILMIYYSIIGIITFVAIYLAIIYNQQRYLNDNFPIIQIMIFSILFILTIILALSSYSLKKEISSQQEYLHNLQKKSKGTEEKIIKIPYNKSGLYSIIIATVLGIIGLLYLYIMLVLQPPSDITFQIGTLETVSVIIFVIMLILILILITTLKILIKRIQTPLYYEYKPCPRCGSLDIHKVEYSWWGGLLGSAIVHQVRCKKCGKSYDGMTGKDNERKVSLYIVIIILILVTLTLLKYIL